MIPNVVLNLLEFDVDADYLVQMIIAEVDDACVVPFIAVRCHCNV